MINALGLLGVAIVDALNPFSIAAMAVLLTMNCPTALGSAFIIGTTLVYFAFGAALLEGWAALSGNLLPILPVWTRGALEVGAGVASLVAAVHVTRQAGEAADTPVVGVSVAAAALFGVASTLSDLPTAVPYFAAAGLIPGLAETRTGRYAWLAAYNVVYVAPLIAMLAVRNALGDAGAGVIDKLRRGVGWSFATLLPPLLAILGFLLLLDGTLRLLEGLR